MNKHIVFDDMTFNDLLKNIHDTTVIKRGEITAMVAKLIDMVKQPEDAMILFPIIRNLMDTAIKNDAHIIQIAQISQRLQSVDSGGPGSGGLLDSEKEKLLSLMNTEMTEVDDKVTETKKELKELSRDILDTR